MRFLFDLDSPIMRFISRFCDIVVLNVVFLLTCIPIFTIGAANTALYDVVFRMDTEREGKLLSTYFRSFRENFRQSTVLWLFLLLFGIATYINMTRFSFLGENSYILGYSLFVVSMMVLVLEVFIFAYAFPLLSRFRNSTWNTAKNALLLSIGNLPRTLIISTINCFPWALLIMNFYTFIQVGFIWPAAYFAAAAYFNSRLLKKVFDALIEK